MWYKTRVCMGPTRLRTHDGRERAVLTKIVELRICVAICIKRTLRHFTGLTAKT